SIPQEAEYIAVKVIRSGAGDDVDHASCRLPIFRRIAVGDDLKFLHRLLRDRRANAIGRIVDRIGAVNVHQVRTRALAAYVQPGRGSRTDTGSVVAQHLRIRQREVDVVAAVDGEVINGLLFDGIGRRGAAGFDQLTRRA